MDDSKIIGLFNDRSEKAIEESQNLYGRFCHYIAYHILKNDSDAQECVNDAMLAAWNSIPPHKPSSLGAFLGKITRNIALNRYDYNNASKRTGDTLAAMEEFFECIPDSSARFEEGVALTDSINRFLSSLDKTTRIVFLQRYWYLCSIDEIAKATKLKQTNVKVMLYRTRQKLKTHLEKEGFSL